MFSSSLCRSLFLDAASSSMFFTTSCFFLYLQPTTKKGLFVIVCRKIRFWHISQTIPKAPIHILLRIALKIFEVLLYKLWDLQNAPGMEVVNTCTATKVGARRTSKLRTMGFIFISHEARSSFVSSTRYE